MIQRLHHRPATIRSAMIVVSVIMVLALPRIADPATLEFLEVTRKSGRYELLAETFLEATPKAIYDVLLEYEDDKFRRISSIYKESRYLEPAPDGTQRVFTLMEGCVMFFCMSMKRTEELETVEHQSIRTLTIPEESNFKYSTSEWILEPTDGGTNMIYKLVMEPDFWVPPIVGPWALKRILASGGVRAISRIERMARGEPMPRRTPRSD